jgi:hypothetical protein
VTSLSCRRAAAHHPSPERALFAVEPLQPPTQPSNQGVALAFIGSVFNSNMKTRPSQLREKDFGRVWLSFFATLGPDGCGSICHHSKGAKVTRTLARASSLRGFILRAIGGVKKLMQTFTLNVDVACIPHVVASFCACVGGWRMNVVVVIDLFSLE